jgi:alpha-methylacyl-CoA racemase
MGPLHGVKVIELAGLGPVSFCAMVLADLGAEVVSVERPVDVADPMVAGVDALRRGRRSVAVDLKHALGVAAVLRLVERADVVVEGFRPGVAERLGLGPEPCLAANPRLVYGRVTGFGQDGPLALGAGHGLSFVALSGVLHASGRAGERPVPPPLALVDFGAGGAMAAFGIVCALVEARASGRGQVVDAAIADAAPYLNTLIHAQFQAGQWRDEQGTNTADTGAPFCDVYETSDGRYVAVAAFEERFYGQLVAGLGLDVDALADRADPVHWDDLRARFAQAFATRTRAEWEEVFAGTDACVTPVLSLAEAPDHPHHRARGTWVGHDGGTTPAPAPRFSRTPGRVGAPPPRTGEHTEAVLLGWGFALEEVAALEQAGAVRRASPAPRRSGPT